MAYSTFMRTGYKPDDYDRLMFHIKGAGKTKPVFVLATSLENSSLQNVEKKIADAEGVIAICQVDGTIDVVVKGEQQARQVAETLYRKAMAPVGIVQYKKQVVGKLYSELMQALNQARKEEKSYHFYNPDKDSLQAIIKAALEKTGTN